MEDDIQNLRQQHLDNYKKAILETINNNTKVLVDDIASLIRKPPLDSMDSLRSKFLELAKKNTLVLNTENLDNLLEEFRNDVINCCESIQTIRIDKLSHTLFHFSLEKDNDVYQLFKKDFISINKEIRGIIKNQLMKSYENILLKKLSLLLGDSVSSEISDKIEKDLTKFFKSNYQKQLLESFDIKVMVKDTTLMNSIKEQAERYLFTLNNSRLLNNFE